MIPNLFKIPGSKGWCGHHQRVIMKGEYFEKCVPRDCDHMTKKVNTQLQPKKTKKHKRRRWSV